jgi:uncharacterized protein (DUF885 family)
MRRLLLVLFLSSTALFAQSKPASKAHDQLSKIKDDFYETSLKESPEQATALGDYRYNDQLGDVSLAHQAQMEKINEDFLARVKAVPENGLSDDDALDRTLLIHALSQRIEGYHLKTFEMPINQFFGAHLRYANMVSLVPTDSVKHYDDYIARLQSIPSRLDQITEVARQGMKDGLMPPKFLLELSATQCKKLADAAGESSPFAVPLKKMPTSFSSEDQKRIHDQIIAAIDNDIRPAYAKLEKFLAEDYAPHGRTDPGLWALPNGDKLYQFAIKSSTTTDYTGEQIHQIGLKQVAEAEAQIAELAKKNGYPSAAAFQKEMHENPKYKAQSRQQILDDFSKYIDQMNAKLPELFGTVPKAKCIVTSVPEYMEKESSTQYQRGTPDGSRAGQVWVRTYDPTHFDMIEDEATAYHEGVPGHHMQISIAQELPNVHKFRRLIGNSAYAEGWALYAERLGKEVGFYQDPGSDLGRLESELFRGIRLVVDTGVHYKHWTRDQMVDYFKQHYPTVPQSEIDRYIGVPAQALSYKLGQLKILELRQRAQQQLGDRFELRKFHDEVLGAGILPLTILDQRVDQWIQQQKSSPAKK